MNLSVIKFKALIYSVYIFDFSDGFIVYTETFSLSLVSRDSYKSHIFVAK